MKCPVPYCGGELKVESRHIIGGGNQRIEYSPTCSECRFIISASFPTPEAALEAMRPVVSEELVKKIMYIVEKLDTHNPKESYTLEYQVDFIKQELEKYNKEQGDARMGTDK